jgi:hypothetical protein
MENVQADKTIQIQKTPNYLTIQLNKLKFSNQEIPKITFPVKGLDLTNLCRSKSSVQSYDVKLEDLF